MGGEGRAEMWYKAPSLSRDVTSFPNFVFQSGDNGRYEWQGFDSLISMTQDSVALVRRYLDSLLLENEDLKRDSKIYEATYSGLTECGSGVCYVVTLTNSLNSDTLIHFFDTVSFVTRRTINVEGDTRFTTAYDDFRLGDGIMRAFLIKETIEPGGGCFVLRLEQVKLNIDIPDSLFEPPYPVSD
jgi:outer membrane lipoprotein-sorting protein